MNRITSMNRVCICKADGEEPSVSNPYPTMGIASDKYNQDKVHLVVFDHDIVIFARDLQMAIKNATNVR